MNHWLIVIPKENQLRSFLQQLANSKIAYFCPAEAYSRPGAGIRLAKAGESFCRFVFVNVSQSQYGWLGKSGYIRNFMFWLNAPVRVPENQIYELKAVFSSYTIQRIERIPLKVDVSLKEPAAYDFTGNEAGDSVFLNLPVIGYRVVVDTREYLRFKKEAPYADLEMTYTKLKLAAIPN